MDGTATATATPSIRQDSYTIAIRTVGYAVISLFSILCVLPFVIMISSSFTAESWIVKHGFSILPMEFSLATYRFLLAYPRTLIGAYAVTILLTASGTAIGLFLTAMTGYALQRQDFPYRNTISFLIYFTTLFSGGLVPFYLLMTKGLHLKDSYLAVLLPSLLSPWLIILMKNFLKTIPHSITESAKIDGAGDFTIFLRLVLPLAKPALATVGLFLAIGYWNEWYNSMLFLSANVPYRPLQLYLYTVINTAFYINNSSAGANVSMDAYPTETMKLAIAVMATIPCLFFYPMIQKYFVNGLTIGAVKG
ncbi:carbohydrate ABC transporter permease [Paenibacillus gansuensis]|uniref:Carbohydrate ABC transporter permease n=1 Tax=Paenibacillus gansuensis TaxID=306542 RepID=A0ABW5P8J5_9BACL